MSEIRKNLISCEYVVIAPERAKKPEDFVSPPKGGPLPEHSEKCPFCPGNEAMTPADTYRFPASGPWQLRCVQNKFSALSPEGELWNRFGTLRQSTAGVGLHEVIVETTKHNVSLGLQPPEVIRRIVRTYHNRFTAFHKDPRISHVIVFKNHGPAAGTSLQHPHSQVVGLPLIPAQVRFRSEEALEFYSDTGSCVVCSTVEDELSDFSRVISDTVHFCAVIPYAALSPYHIWILPKRHGGCFGEATEEELDDLAGLLGNVLGRLYKGLNDPSYNLVIRSSSPSESGARHLHWYLAIVPRITRSAGFELGTGMYINSSLPENSAEFLRNVNMG